MSLHNALSKNLLPNPTDEGRIHQHAVDIGKSVYRPVSDIHFINETLDLLLEKASVIIDPFEQSFFMMVYLPYLQAFADINKRTSQLVTNLPLFRANLCPLTFLDVPEQAYSRAVLGLHELTRVKLLRDIYMCGLTNGRPKNILPLSRTLQSQTPIDSLTGTSLKSPFVKSCCI